MQELEYVDSSLIDITTFPLGLLSQTTYSPFYVHAHIEGGGRGERTDLNEASRYQCHLSN